MGDTLTTYTGKEMNSFAPTPDMIDIRDIAHALSLEARANGHYEYFYSVAQHCIQCCREAIARHYVPRLALACLLHDGSEAYMSDVTAPLKKYMTMYLQIEKQLQDMIYEKFLGYVPEGEEMKLIRNIDSACKYYEAKHFYHREEGTAPYMLTTLSFKKQHMADVEQEFLELYRQLIEAMAEED